MTVAEQITHTSILTFWFEELSPADWWRKNIRLDTQIHQRFGDIHRQAVRCEFSSWRDTAEGRLAEVIVLDQFSRNIYRDSPEAFSCDAMALVLAQEAIKQSADKALPPARRAFLYLPFMHSESSIIHKTALTLYEDLGLKENLAAAIQHKKIIDRFGRYPHRNDILGRESSQEEKLFLTEPNSSF